MRTVLPDYRLDPPEYPDPPGCPVCGSTEYAEIYKGDGVVLGCDACVSCLCAEDWWEELEEEMEDAQWTYEEDR